MAQVLRDGKWEQVNARELVIGDIIEVKSGDRVPGDIRILSANSFKVWDFSIQLLSDYINKLK